MTVYVEINTKSNKIMTTIIYRPLKSQAADDTALCEEIRSVIQSKQAVIVGDFNCPNFDWTSMNWDLLKWQRTHSLHNNMKDSVFASDPDLVRDLKVSEKLGSCDHHLIRFNVKTKYTLANNKTKIIDYKRANFNLARQLITPAT